MKIYNSNSVGRCVVAVWTNLYPTDVVLDRCPESAKVAVTNRDAKKEYDKSVKKSIFSGKFVNITSDPLINKDKMIKCAIVRG